MLAWVARMSWYVPPCFYTFPAVSFSMQLLDRGQHPYISTGFDEKHFYFPCFCPFYGMPAAHHEDLTFNS